jgi:hypothetical protein
MKNTVSTFLNLACAGGLLLSLAAPLQAQGDI